MASGVECNSTRCYRAAADRDQTHHWLLTGQHAKKAKHHCTSKGIGSFHSGLFGTVAVEATCSDWGGAILWANVEHGRSLNIATVIKHVWDCRHKVLSTFSTYGSCSQLLLDAPGQHTQVRVQCTTLDYIHCA